MRAFIRSLHKAWAAAADDVATHLCQFGGELLHSLICRRGGLEACRAEDRHAIILARGAPEARQLVDDFPETGHCAFEKFDGRIFVTEANDVGLSERFFLAHVVVGFDGSSARS